MLDKIEEVCEGQEFDQVLQLLQELELNTPQEVRKQRAHARRQIALEVVVRPGSSSLRGQSEIRGTTADISEGGCQAVLPAPCGVGDVFFLEFDRQALDLPQVFARCLRCRLVREDAFETGFCFFTPITLPVELLD
jgi:c-di-GMP-binding flagellar brake protein YcgR